ncbi:MAG: DUF5107 domain-containing protein [Chloroflexi bacterium RBG_16_54_18]|nr:MAG: DUF5107 domain-containing protein [Chloroflexi bacterium RBG_16_54_18]
MDDVKAWAEPVVIPTYRIGEPVKYPMFLEKRVYQGSSGVVYPHPVIDRITGEKYDRQYTGVFLENRYLKILILPEIGGRVQMALDKTNGYHFVYYNRVIKPALVGLAGPWISGGIEFNWPQHHRPSTFDPLLWRIIENPDGSRTVWCSEIERMFHTRGTHSFTLHPDQAYLEVGVKLHNRTCTPQTFLWWANPAVHVHDETQSIFPPDVHAVMDHGKRDVSDFPIATGVYYKVNYFPGTDISRYRNIPVPTSFMAYRSDYDFIGNYDYRARAGMLHVANHHIVPGKKQWTWGNGDFGRAWDRQLTDEDGPYIELMCGAYTDNQPDFSWIMPGEEKSFKQYFLPYKHIGAVKNATREIALNLEIQGSEARIGVYATRPREVKVQLLAGATLVFERNLNLSPETAFDECFTLPPAPKNCDLRLSVWDGDQLLVEYTPQKSESRPIPAPAVPARLPQEIATNEELYLNGLHLEQYRHATYAAESYYEEALRRDPFDSRCNNAMGLLLYRQGMFAQAEMHFRKTIRRLTVRNPNPYDGEAYYNLGLSLKMQGRLAEAYDAFYKSIWNGTWLDAGYLELARLECRKRQYQEALSSVERSLSRNSRNQQVRHLKIALLRHTGLVEQAGVEVVKSLEDDPLDFAALWEGFLLDGDGSFAEIVRDSAQVCQALANDYAQCGWWDDAMRVLQQGKQSDPMLHYMHGWLLQESGDEEKARHAFRMAKSLPADYCFPNRLEDIEMLQEAMRVDPTDARASYYLGNFWYAHRRYGEAIECWERALTLDGNFPAVQRNLGLAYYNVHKDVVRAWLSLDAAFKLSPGDARLLFELDQLEKKRNSSPQQRLSRLEGHLDLVEERDDLSIEMVTLHNLLGEPGRAYEMLMKRVFHPWEGGEGKTTGQYVTSLVEMGKSALVRGDYAVALEFLEHAQAYPDNLGEGKLAGAQENHIHYYFGQVYEAMGKKELAREHFEKAASGLTEPTSALYYNDQPPEMIYYQGLARRSLGQEDEAECIFQKLVEYGRNHWHDEVQVDYFAVSLPDFLVFEQDLGLLNKIHCHYMMALGYTGLTEREQAEQQFEQVLALDACHLGAAVHRKMLSDQFLT